MSEEKRVPFAAHCHNCGHVWAVAYFPIPAGDLPKRFKCGLCFETKRIMVARDADRAKLPQPLICEVPK